jgi:hypothetical protein
LPEVITSTPQPSSASPMSRVMPKPAAEFSAFAIVQSMS